MPDVVLRPGKPARVRDEKPRAGETHARAGKSLGRWLASIIARDARGRPGFADAWVSLRPVQAGDILARYSVGTARVEICSVNGGTETLYRLTPREYTLPEPAVKLLHASKRAFMSRTDESRGGMRPAEMRTRLRRPAADIIGALAGTMRISSGQLEAMGGLDFLADVLLRHTVGLGVLEYLLEDGNVQDIYIDAPAEDNPVHVVIGSVGQGRVQGRCVSNVMMTGQEVEALVSRFRYESGRPFSEAMPVLETDLEGHDTRVTVVGRPLSPGGIAIALRRHSSEPWTLPRLIAMGSLNPLAAGLLSFLIDGRSTILVAGSRGAGKSSLLGALMLEFPVSQRILTIEDTLELPGAKMQELGYKVQSLLVQSALGGIGDMSADDALRVSLRLGESAIVLGEVRGREARTLYEAMRSGSAGSAVLGTIHGSSPRSVFERIVYDLDIHPEAFSATDIVVICGLVRPEGRQAQVRRVTAISELVKDGQPGEFADLMVYDPDRDGLVETRHMLNSSSRISIIAEQWGLTYQEAVENIRARGYMRQRMTELAAQGYANLLTPSAVVKTNGRYWHLVEEAGSREPGKLMARWSQWFDRSAPYV